MTNEKMLTLLNSFLSNNNYVTIAELKAGLEENIRESVNKNSGKPSLAKAMNSVIKSAKKEGVRPSLMGAFMNEEWLTVCDGYRAIQTREPLELEQAKQDGQPLNVSKLFSDVDAYYNKEVKLPTIPELKAFIKMAKAGSGEKIIKLTGEQDEVIAFNPEYLLTVLEAIPSEYGRYNTPINPMYLGNDTTRGMVLPIRIAK